MAHDEEETQAEPNLPSEPVPQTDPPEDPEPKPPGTSKVVVEEELECFEVQLSPDGNGGPAAEPEGHFEDGEESKPGAKKRLGAWFGKHTKKVVSQLYESRVDDIEHRARRAVSSAYEDQADDLEERAVRAMRTALTEESDRIKEVIEHAIQVKKREVRLSLIVLVAASLIYMLLYWATR